MTPLLYDANNDTPETFGGEHDNEVADIAPVAVPTLRRFARGAAWAQLLICGVLAESEGLAGWIVAGLAIAALAVLWVTMPGKAETEGMP